MKKFSYDFTIDALDEKEAKTKMNAISILASRLNSNELTKLAYILENDPAKTAMAKRYLKV